MVSLNLCASEATAASHLILDFPLRLVDVQAERLAAKRRQLLHPTLHVDTAAGGWHTTLMADDRDLAGAVINVIELKRHERHSPAPGHGAFHRDGLVVVASRLVFQLRNVHGTKRAAGNQKRAHEREYETRSLGHVCNS